MAEALLPPEVLQTVDDLDRALQKVEEQLSCVLPSCTRESFEQLSFVERASTFSALSKALTVLFTVYLKTNGISPDDHPANSEMGRTDLYENKVQKAVDRSTGVVSLTQCIVKSGLLLLWSSCVLASELYQRGVEIHVLCPTRPCSSLDVKAANRFIEHAIPDLSEEQKRSMREIGKKGAPKRQHERGTTNSTPKKRSSGLTLAEEAAAFLVEASKEAMVKTEGAAFREKD